MKKILLYFVLIILTYSCSKEELIPYTNEELANEELYPYLEFFIQEAEKRGFDFSDHSIDFYFADIDFQDAVGLSVGSSQILVDKEFWSRANGEKREWLIFHELGHSILNREHKNDKTETGECLSFMRGSENNFECSMNLLSSLWRKHYLDELFNENAALPEWYIRNQEYDMSYSNKRDIINSTSSTPFFQEIDLNNIENFVVEIEFSRLQDNTSSLSNFSSFIDFNGYYFIASEGISGKSIKINRDTNTYFENNEYSFEEGVKLTIRKTENLLQFFVNNQFFHVMEIEQFDTTVLTVVTANEVQENLTFSINVFEFD